MYTESELYAEFLRILGGIDFASRYYRYIEANAGEVNTDITLSKIKQIVDEIGMEFRYDKKETCFFHEEVSNGYEFHFHVAILYHSCLDFGMTVKVCDKYVGSAYKGLAEDVVRLKDPLFEHVPRYPTITFSTDAELRKGLEFGIGLFRDMKAAIISNAFLKETGSARPKKQETASGRATM
jgi:hypothetical protein